MNTSTGRDWSTPLRTDTIEGRKIPIYVDEDGSFFARLDSDDPVGAESLKALHEKLRKRLRTASTRLAIPVTLCAGSGTDGWASRREREPNVEDATITGIHGGNNNVLMKRANGVTEQISTGESDGGVVCKRLTAAQKKQFLTLATRRLEAVRAMREFIDSVKIGYIKSFVEAEVQAAAIADRAKGA